MKKSTLLSFATAAAIVVTSAGTYAAWDTTTKASNETTVTMAKKVDMEVSTLAFTTAEKTTIDETVPSQTATVNVTVKDVPTGAKDNYKLDTTATITNSDGTPITDSSVTATAVPENSTLSGEATDLHPVTVTVTPLTDEAAGKEYKVKVTANIVENKGV